MYYIADGNKRKGPFSEGDLVANGLGRNTLVWREGLPDWLPAEKVETLTAVVASIPPPVPRPAVPPPLPLRPVRTVAPAATDPTPWRPDETVAATGRGSVSFADWWIYYMAAAISTYLFGLVMIFASAGYVWLLVMASFLVSFFAMKAIESILLYRLWGVVQDEEVRTTPAKAVGYLFIPFYNCYWFYVGLGGLAEEYNRVARRRGIAIPPVSKPLALVASGLGSLAVGIVPILGVSTLVIMLIYLRSLARAADLITAATD